MCLCARRESQPRIHELLEQLVGPQAVAQRAQPAAQQHHQQQQQQKQQGSATATAAAAGRVAAAPLPRRAWPPPPPKHTDSDFVAQVSA